MWREGRIVFLHCETSRRVGLRPLPVPTPLSSLPSASRTMVGTCPTCVRAGVGRDRRREAIFLEGNGRQKTTDEREVVCSRSLSHHSKKVFLFHLYIIRGGEKGMHIHTAKTRAQRGAGERAAVPARLLSRRLRITSLPCFSTRSPRSKRKRQDTHWALVLLLSSFFSTPTATPPWAGRPATEWTHRWSQSSSPAGWPGEPPGWRSAHPAGRRAGRQSRGRPAWRDARS